MAHIDMEDAEGRKLAKVIDHWGDWLLIFEGGDVVVLVAQSGDCGDDPAVVKGDFFLPNWLPYDGELLRHGVVTQDELDKCRAKQKLRKERDLAEKIAEVERLKREIEGV